MAAPHAIERSPERAPVSGPVAVVTPARAEVRAFDLGEMTEAEFDRALAVMETRKKRVGRILENFLVEGVHFGNPETGNGRKAFTKPQLYLSGAEELRSIFGLTQVYLSEPVIVATAELVSVRVTIGIEDRNGRILGSRSGACSSMERRFKLRNGRGFTYDDPREVLHDCLSMAEKRAATLATRAALGLTGYLGAEDTDDADEEEERPLAKWTDEEKKRVYDAAVAKGLTRKQMKDLVVMTLGREEVGTGADVEKLLAAIEAFEGAQPAKENGTKTSDDQGGGPAGNTGTDEVCADPGVARPDPVAAAAEQAKTKAEPKKKGEPVPRNQAYRDGEKLDDATLGF